MSIDYCIKTYNFNFQSTVENAQAISVQTLTSKRSS
ncbi:MAG: hypothetical protein RL662_1893 [Bacteroidota bacterium]|jgi:hypothetical protein